MLTPFTCACRHNFDLSLRARRLACHLAFARRIAGVA
jgi:hypothetical protein